MRLISVVMYLLLIYIIFLPFNYIECHRSDTFRGRLEQIPERLVPLTRGLWGEGGIPKWLTDIYAPVYATSDSLCQRESEIYKEALQNFSLWAFQMFDSSSKLQSGILYAHFKDLGSFDECIDVDAISPFKVQQCLVELRGIVKYPKVPGDLDDVETIVGGLPLLKPHLGLAMCVPASCNRSELLDHYNEVFSHLNLTPIINQYSCSTKDPAPFYFFDWVMGFVCGGVFLLVIMTSVFDIAGSRRLKQKGGRFWKLLECFSTRRTLCHIVSKKDPNKPLASLRGLRFLCVLWIVYSHNYACVAFQPTLNWIHIYNMMESLSGAIFLNGKCAVDLFLVMSGLLLCYIFLDMMESGKKFNLWLFYLHRIVRILPMYAVVVFLGLTFYPRYASGPQWNHLIKRHEQNCRDHWWTNMLFINNYVHTDRQCNPQTWYLAVDMQLYLLSPLILFPVYKSRIFRRVGLPSLVLISIIISFLISYSHQIPAGSIIARDLQTMESYSTEYITTHTRFGSWVIGIGLGYLLYQAKNTKIKLSKLTVACCWLFSAVVCTTILFGITYFNQPEREYNRVQSAIYTSLHSTLWSLATGWMIFACETGYADTLKNVLTCRFLQPLGNLSFAIYLLHGSFQFVLSAMMRTPAYLDFMPNMVMMLGVVVLTAASGLLFSVLFELPFMNLEYVLTRRGQTKAKNIPEKNGNDVLPKKTLSNTNITRF
ncbi:O-acyltransferase like protein-like [Nilaparvata lugens]|uniref:O-acyltransferase like protein-like n=1 Tax=Nilaparvata lugens TaxID=108931 RepID=UPI00193D9A8F|nr:O-acyltransferase like protein-like [Nilaparvata lugens]